MLKIKDDVDLKELEMFDPELIDDNEIVFVNGCEILEFDTDSRELIELVEYGSLWLDKLFDLIQAGLVEKVVEE